VFFTRTASSAAALVEFFEGSAVNGSKGRTEKNQIKEREREREREEGTLHSSLTISNPKTKQKHTNIGEKQTIQNIDYRKRK